MGSNFIKAITEEVRNAYKNNVLSTSSPNDDVMGYIISHLPDTSNGEYALNFLRKNYGYTDFSDEVSNLQDDLSISESEVQKLENKIEVYASEVEELEETLTELEETVDEQKQKITELEETIRLST